MISIDDRIYVAPAAIDDREEERLRDQHEMVFKIFGDRLLSLGYQLLSPRRY
jgi:hypothetical protein